MAQLSRQHGIHPSLITRWKKEYRDNPENASGKGNIYKEDARLGELERVIGQLYTENYFLKKALSNLEMRLQEQRRKDTQR
jgi:transposase-like protein